MRLEGRVFVKQLEGCHPSVSYLDLALRKSNVVVNLAYLIILEQNRKMLKRSGPKKLKSIIENCALKCMKNKISKNEIRLILNWQNIVGKEIAECTKPKNINSGVLHLVVTNGSKALEIQHMISLIIEKITIFFGYKAVYGIKIKQESIDYLTI